MVYLIGQWQQGQLGNLPLESAIAIDVTVAVNRGYAAQVRVQDL